ncbi:nineteen complex-related protein [Orobanche gracilis]
MEEANLLTKYGSKVYIIHRRNEFRASKIMQIRALLNTKIEILWDSTVTEAYGERTLGGLKVENVRSGKVLDLKVSGLFFAIGHEPATKFLDGQLELDSDGYVITKPGTPLTNIKGVFAAGDVQDKKYRQAITAAGSDNYEKYKEANREAKKVIREARAKVNRDLVLVEEKSIKERWRSYFDNLFNGDRCQDVGDISISHDM